MQATLQTRWAQVLESNETLRRKIDAQWKVNESLKGELAAAQQQTASHTDGIVVKGSPSRSDDTDVVMDADGMEE